MANQLARLAMKAKIPKTVTGIMPRYGSPEAGAHVVHSQHINEKPTKFIATLGHGARAVAPGFIVWKEFREMMDHRGARAGGTDNSVAFSCFKDLNKTPCQHSGIVSEPGVKSRLPAACLLLVEYDFAPGAP